MNRNSITSNSIHKLIYMKQRPPVPKFIEECKTPEPQRSLIDEVIEYIYKNDLDSNVEKKAIQVLSTCRLQTNKYSVMGLVNYCLKSLGQIVPEMNKKTESVFKLIDVQQSLLIESICERMKLDQRVTNDALDQQTPSITPERNDYKDHHRSGIQQTWRIEYQICCLPYQSFRRNYQKLIKEDIAFRQRNHPKSLYFLSNQPHLIYKFFQIVQNYSKNYHLKPKKKFLRQFSASFISKNLIVIYYWIYQIECSQNNAIEISYDTQQLF
ncbi:hypothetical protein pb186bvf_009311 [Paramecium bursaria]